jgi:hypothetical protein
VASEREQRLAKNEALFRVANERAAGWEERQGENRPESYYCECAETACREKVSLTRDEYERVRSDATHFFVVPGHQIPDIESVVETHEGWFVIEKAPETHEIVKATDLRQDG